MWCAVIRRSALLCSGGVRAYARRARAANPGLQQRAGAFEDAGITFPPDSDLEEMLEESETDMRNVHLSHKKHEREMKIQRETLRHQIVQRKYMDETMPNLLTWSEKEQIRHLATEHPEDWTPERLAESFPVTESVVKKLLKYPWRPASMERIARHDASAMRNWRELKEGTLDIPPQLRAQFLKFSDRSIPPLKESSVKEEISKQEMGEFQSIIQKCADNDDTKENRLELKDGNNNNSSDSVRNEFRLDPKRVTLDRLKQKIDKRLSLGQDVDTTDQLILAFNHKDDPVNPVGASEYALESSSEEETAVHQFKENAKEITPAVYPERIRIPKSAWKKGGTYKVNDCYYDDDGTFLYRVPGM